MCQACRILDSDHVWSWYFGLEFVTQSTDILFEFSRLLSPVSTSLRITFPHENCFSSSKHGFWSWHAVWSGHILSTSKPERARPIAVTSFQVRGGGLKDSNGFKFLVPRKEGNVQRYFLWCFYMILHYVMFDINMLELETHTHTHIRRLPSYQMNFQRRKQQYLRTCNYLYSWNLTLAVILTETSPEINISLRFHSPTSSHWKVSTSNNPFLGSSPEPSIGKHNHQHTVYMFSLNFANSFFYFS